MGAMTSPLYLLGPPLLLLISIPLTIFAIATTTIALSALAVRVSIVYFELSIALIHSHLFPPPQKPAPKRPTSRTSPQRSRNSRSSIASTTSSQDTAIPHAQPPRMHNKSGSFASLIGTSELTRDFEGVGGWRLPGDDEEEALWMGMNSRLELPAVLPARKHQRSLTGGSQRYSWGPETMHMSPMQSRVRTPVSGERFGGEEYFPSSSGVRPFSTASDPTAKTTQDGRRKSFSGSSSSSGGSRRTSMPAKQYGE
ncbi:hypothetical protein EJ04DRAFT_299312 [Polyplosphaeria fusca]|uniref:Uncharacterized protein n=1 Tax=Polyplosphaeria fusca TaxID=682080 RepID=A0A9P4QXK9_9PLEO|nr:hypothetical protein EJ04DRAFT_299312 [Polyplosphaeria fusca]